MVDYNGVYTAIITPFDKNGNIDYCKLKELIDFQIKKGITGLVFGGTTGEGMLINDIVDFYKNALRLVNKRTKVFLTIFEFSNDILDNRISQLNQLDFDGYLINTPYYLNTSQNGIYKFFEYINSKVNKGFIVYYNPLRSNQYITLKVWSLILKLENFIGVKDASMNNTYNIKLQNIMKNHYYFVGNDSRYYLHLTNGVNGIISSLSNALPELFVKIYFSCMNKEYVLASKMFNKYVNLISTINIEPNPIGIKYFMNLLGHDVGKPKFPLTEYSLVYQIKLKSIYKEILNENFNYW